jgi:aspartate aminotransferase-like enzyme
MKGVADSFGKTISELADPRKYQTMEDTFADMFYGLVGQAASAFSEKIMQEGAKYMFDYMGQFSDTFNGMSATVGKTSEELATKANTTSMNMLTSSINALNTSMAATMPNVASSSLSSAAETAKLANATREAVKALGLKLFAPNSPSDSVTAVLAPEGINGQDAQLIFQLS